MEAGDLALEVLHPGGLAITHELAELCRVGEGARVLDCASGTGESACAIAETFGARAVGIDASGIVIGRARKKAQERRLDRVEFVKGDALNLPFGEAAFDAAISECTTCLLDRERAIAEMGRVVRPGGHVGIHDLCWREAAPQHLKSKLAEREGERPETLEGWRSLFQRAGLRDVTALDRSPLLTAWIEGTKRRLGLGGRLKLFLKILRRWGIGGFLRVRESEEVFRSEHLGYGLIVGRKP